MLHDSSDHHVFAVGECVHVHFNRIFEEVIDQHGAVMRVLNRLLHVPNYRLLVVGNHHSATAQHVRGSHHYWIFHALGAFDGFFERGGHHSCGLRNFQFFE